MFNFKKYFIWIGLVLLIVGYLVFNTNSQQNKIGPGKSLPLTQVKPEPVEKKLATPAAPTIHETQSVRGDFPGVSLKTTSSFDGSFSKIKADSLGAFHKNQLSGEIEEFLKSHPSLLKAYPPLKKGKITTDETPFFHIVNYSFKWHGLPYPGSFKFFFRKETPLQLEEIQNIMPVLEKFNDCEEHSRDEAPGIVQNFYGDEKIQITKVSERKTISSSGKTGIIGVDVFYKIKKGNFLVTINLCSGEIMGLPRLRDFH